MNEFTNQNTSESSYPTLSSNLTTGMNQSNPESQIMSPIQSANRGSTTSSRSWDQGRSLSWWT